MNAHVRPPKIEPLAMRAETAAAALDVSPNTFLKWVKEGKMPKGVRVDGCVLYDTEAVRNAWRALKEAGPRDDANELD